MQHRRVWLLVALPAAAATAALVGRDSYWPAVAAGGLLATGVFLLAETARLRARTPATLFAVILTGVLVGLNLLALPAGEPVRAGLATLLLALASYPLWRYLRRREECLPFIPLLSAIHALNYAIPVLVPFAAAFSFRHASDGAREEALLLSLGGLAILQFVYYRFPIQVWAGWLPQFRGSKRERSDRGARAAGVGLGVVGLVTSASVLIIAVPPSLGSIVGFLAQGSLLALALLYHLQTRARLPAPYGVFLWGLIVPAQLTLDLSTGAVFPFVRTLSVIAMIYLTARKRIPWMRLLAGAGVIVVLLATKGAFRTMTASSTGEFSARNPMITGRVYSQAITESNVLGGSEDVYRALQVVVNRLDKHSLLATVVDWTPARVPYWGGRTYANVIWALIPRVVFPGKPTETLGQDFGHRYGFLSSHDSSTSVNLPQLIELYANFGPIGALVGMGILGLLYQLLRHVFENPAAGAWGRVSAAVIYSQLIVTESNFTLVFGNLVYWVVLLYLLGRVIFPVASSSPRLRAAGSYRSGVGNERIPAARLNGRP